MLYYLLKVRNGLDCTALGKTTWCLAQIKIIQIFIHVKIRDYDFNFYSLIIIVTPELGITQYFYVINLVYVNVSIIIYIAFACIFHIKKLHFTLSFYSTASPPQSEGGNQRLLNHAYRDCRQGRFLPAHRQDRFIKRDR